MFDVGCWMLYVGCCRLGAGCWVLGVARCMLDVGCLAFGSWLVAGLCWMLYV